MPSTKIDGRLLRFYVNGFPIACAQSGTFTINKDAIEVTCKDSSGNAEFITGQLSWEGSADGVIDFSSTFGLQELNEKMIAGTSVTLLWSTKVTGDTQFQGTALITSVESSGGVNEAATLSVTFQGTGAITQSDAA